MFNGDDTPDPQSIAASEVLSKTATDLEFSVMSPPTSAYDSRYYPELVKFRKNGQYIAILIQAGEYMQEGYAYCWR